MRYHAARTNRAWLFVLGLLLLLAGVAGLAVATGRLGRLGAAAGLDLTRPTTADTVAGAAATSLLETRGAAAGVLVGGLLLALAGLAWLVRQLPRRGLAKPFRLTDDVEQGLTRVAPGVLGDAVEQQVGSFAGVSRATARLRGSVRDPELTVRVTADERTDVRQLLSRIQQETVRDLETALDTTVTRLGVQVEVDRSRSGVGHVVL